MHNFFSSANVVHLQMDNIVALKRWGRGGTHNRVLPDLANKSGIVGQ